MAAQTPFRVVDVLTSQNTGMLSNWYLQSYVNDSIVGYDYGIPVVNYAITGYLPFHFFPSKYFLEDWLYSQQPPIPDPTLVQALYGQKVSIVGSFYSEGGFLGVVGLMALMGYLSRKLDGLVQQGAPVLVRATGLVWMSTLWMVWASGDTWTINLLGTLALPTIALWILAPKRGRSKLRSVPGTFELSSRAGGTQAFAPIARGERAQI
jgi:hypothetical protein